MNTLFATAWRPPETPPRLSVARAVGSPETVAEKIAAFVEHTQADEIIVSGATFDPAARRRSLELTADALVA